MCDSDRNKSDGTEDYAMLKPAPGGHIRSETHICDDTCPEYEILGFRDGRARSTDFLQIEGFGQPFDVGEGV